MPITPSGRCVTRGSCADFPRMAPRESRPRAHRGELSAREFRELFRDVANWGRWSERPEAGALNYITADRIAAAARLVERGVTVSLGRPLNTHEGIDNPEPANHEMTLLPDVDIGSGSARFAKDYIGVDYHNEGHSHIDALCHVAYDGVLYGGTPAAAVTSRVRGRRDRPAAAPASWVAGCCSTSPASGGSAGSNRASTSSPTTSRRRSGSRASAWTPATSCSSAQDTHTASPTSGRGTRRRPRSASTRARRGSSPPEASPHSDRTATTTRPRAPPKGSRSRSTSSR